MSFLHHDSNAFRISHKVQVDPSSEALVGWTVGAAWQSFCRFHSRNEPRGHLYHMQMWSESYRSTGNSLSPIISSGMRCHYKLVGADTELNEPDIVFCVIQDVTWTSIRCRLCSQQCFHFSILEFPKAIFLSTLTSIPPQLVLVRSATKEIRGAIGTSSRHSKLAFDSLIAAPAIV